MAFHWTARLRPSVIILSGLTVASSVFYFWNVHRRLSQQVNHLQYLLTDDLSAVLSAGKFQDVRSLPSDILAQPESYKIFHDKATKEVARISLPKHLTLRDMLNTYLRYNMCNFAPLPQARVMYLMSDVSVRKTFAQDYLQSLAFEESDMVCGFYQVAYREDNKAELSMKLGKVEGRLIIGVKEIPSEGNDVTEKMVQFYGETLMWVKKSDKVVMPMERSLPRFFHEIASWGSLKAGTEHLKSLAAENKKSL